MSNTLTLAEHYLPILDEVYKQASKSAILDGSNDRVKFVGGNKIELFKIALNGMGNYSRSTGFVAGDVTGTWESMTLGQDRGRSYQIDAMDNEEQLSMTVGSTLNEIERRYVIPELDAYRFAKLAAASGVDGTAADITAGTTDVPGLIDDAEESMGDNEVPVEGRILFVSELCYKALKAKITRVVANENGINHEIEVYDGMRIVRMPKARFCTGITLLDGTTSGQTNGGYKFTASSSKPINFMIVHPSAVISVVKHEVPRIFAPAQNIDADAYRIQHRIYHDIFVEENKVKGIYVHKASTGLSADITG